MDNKKDLASKRIDELSNQIRQQFEQIGQDVKSQLVDDFDKILLDDLESVKSVLQDLVRSKTNEILNQSKNELGQIIDKEFGGSIFGQILNDTVLPTLFDKIGFGSSSSFVPRFSKSSNQQFQEISQSISRSNIRNS